MDRVSRSIHPSPGTTPNGLLEYIRESPPKKHATESPRLARIAQPRKGSGSEGAARLRGDAEALDWACLTRVPADVVTKSQTTNDNTAEAPTINA